MAIRLAIVDAHTLTRCGLRELACRQAGEDIEVVAEAGSEAEARRVIATARPDVVTLDAALPDGDGLRLARELRAQRADLGIVILACRTSDQQMLRALEVGASAYVAKTAPAEEAFAAIRHAAVAAASFTASGLAQALARRQAAKGQLILSRRETEVLHLLRDGLSVPAIAGTMFLSLSTTKTYVARLYSKLGAANRAQALMAAVRHGLLCWDEEAPATAVPGGHGARPVPVPRSAGPLVSVRVALRLRVGPPCPMALTAGRSAAGHGADHQERLRPGADRLRQRGAGRVLREIPLAGEEPHERPALAAHRVPDRAAQHRVGGLQRVQHRAQRGPPGHVELHLAVHPRQHPQVGRQHHPDHGRVWASTERTAGRSRTIADQLSPASAEAYTCPPVVPKYTPHSSSESTDIASRSTFT
jgi:DNA-binding NarL/FixJ family response regulator